MVTMILQDFDLAQIAASGQCFTWRRLDAPPAQTRYAVLALGRRLEVVQMGNQFTFSCTQLEFDSVWRSYLDLDTDYGAMKRAVDPADAYLVAAVQYGWGIRVLRQDLWEMLVSFLISQNNNITRITRSVEGLCTQYGALKSDTGGQYRAFPSPDALSTGTVSDFEALGLGYRAKYLVRLAAELKNGGLDALRRALDTLDDAGARARLMAIYGVGGKVADCVCLFGLHRIDAFPVDTHIQKILDAHYPAGFPTARYQGFLGILQQYLFYYDLKKKGF